MAKKRTIPSRVRGRYVQHIKVHSPRIVLFRSLKVLKRSCRLFVVLALLGLAVWGAHKGWQHFAYNSDEFRLREIDLTTNGQMTPARIIEVCEIDPNASVFTFDLKEIDRRLTALPEVSKATVYRRLPGILRVEVEERKPLAWVACPELGIVGRDPIKGLLLDENMVMFSCDPKVFDNVAQLPVIILPLQKEDAIAPDKSLVHEAGQRAFALVRQHGEVSETLLGYPNIDYIELSESPWMTVTFAVGTQAKFGHYDHDRQLKDLAELWRHAQGEDKHLAQANLLPRRNLPVVLTPLNSTEVTP